ncbi:hypothetical protein LTR59_017282 [Friedmanniomyces endolithicus]|nr:hypothetical protein LTR94_021956 [Friedmanniomyces endolithicus]KAK0769014.1 hypothetical protein LTR59_017282 [Friedmanniomyces endolithicus]KAK0780581.1 hypothetical protein LTR38_014014 [Friedmanniomyces endolithicus]
MIVPRAYRYSSSPPNDAYSDEKSGGRWTTRKSSTAKVDITLPIRPLPADRTATEPTRAVSKPMAVPLPERSRSGTVQTLPTRNRKEPTKARTTPHDANALPPAVAALLAITTIPRPRPNQFKRQPRGQRRVSIDELVSSWKSDDGMKPSFSSSPALSILLEDASDLEETTAVSQNSAPEDGFLRTPESLRSLKSSSTHKREKSRPIVPREDTSLDHPLVPVVVATAPDDDVFTLSPPQSRPVTPKTKSTFTSNLTTSLRAFKNATLTSLATFTISNVTLPSQRPTSSSRFSDETLWSHPFLFPRLSSEIRPATLAGKPTSAQRRYLNPPPSLTFEEQETPFQLALHAPYLAERVDESPTIPMQTYNRGKRKAGTPKRAVAPAGAAGAAAGLDPNSEAGRAALLGVSGVRQREPRENSDFLRVVVLEMNMRRRGKLESGRARIWLPPRQGTSVVGGDVEGGGVPGRWVGVSAYD